MNSKLDYLSLLVQGCACVDLIRAVLDFRQQDVQGGLATAFDLAAFRLSMIAPVKKSVNHPRTVGVWE